MSDTLITPMPEGTVTGTEGAYPYIDQTGLIAHGSVGPGVGNYLTLYTPSHGPAFGMVVIALTAFNDAGQDITFPIGFVDVPAVVGNTTGLTPSALTKSKINLGATGGVATGYVILIGNTA